MRWIARLAVMIAVGCAARVEAQRGGTQTNTTAPLLDSRVVGNCVIALSGSGEVLRCDLKTVQLTRCRQLPSAAVCLGEFDERSVLVGASNGAVYQVSVADLSATIFAQLTNTPVWIGHATWEGRQAFTVLVATIEYVPKTCKQQVQIHDLTHHQAYSWTPASLMGSLSKPTFLPGPKDRIWIGVDQGEWGGWAGLLDLTTGELCESRSQPRGVIEFRPDEKSESWPGGVYGFIGFGTGRVWAYGGTSHMGFNQAFIGRVDTGRLELLYKNEWSQFTGTDRPADNPTLPITHIVPVPNSESLLVFSYDDVFQVGPELKRWKRICELPLRYNPGRPDAVGSYPAVKQVHVLGGQQRSFLCSTASDGFVRFADGRVTFYPIVLPRRD